MTLTPLLHELHPLFQIAQATENVGSYMELYTTLYGLKAGEVFFSLFWSLGIFKLIFGVIAWMTVIEGMRIGGADGGWFIIRTLGWRFFRCVFNAGIFYLANRHARYWPDALFAAADLCHRK